MTRSATLAIGVFLLAAFIQTAPLSLAEQGTHAVTGIVTDDQGRPVARATVYGFTRADDGSESHDKNLTAEDGTFTLHLAAGRGEVRAQHPEHRQDAWAQVAVPQEGDVKLVLPTPPPRNAIVEGRVLDERGSPVAGAQVSIVQGCCMEEKVLVDPAPPTTPDASGNGTSATSRGSTSPGSAGMTRPMVWYDGDHQTATTGADGAYRFETYPGMRQVTAHAEGYAQATTTVDALADQTVRADLTLEKAPPVDATLVVRLVDAATGAPIRGAGVSLQNAEWSHYAWAETGADGTARLTTVAGWAIVNVHHYGHAIPVEGDAAVERVRAPETQYYTYAKALRLASGERSLDAKLEPKPRGTVALTGYVLDPDAKTGVPNAQVNVWNQDTGDWGSATTDATGSYRFLVRPGHYTMNAWADGHLPGVATFAIADGEAAKRVDVEAPRGKQKHAPCIDGCPEPMPAAEMRGGGAATLMATDDADAPQLRDMKAANAETDATRGTAYAGSGGGLPPYDADAAVDGQSAGDAGSRAEVPAIGAGAALVLLAILALARRR